MSFYCQILSFYRREQRKIRRTVCDMGCILDTPLTALDSAVEAAFRSLFPTYPCHLEHPRGFRASTPHLYCAQLRNPFAIRLKPLVVGIYSRIMIQGFLRVQDFVHSL